MDPYDVFLLVLGTAIVATAVLPRKLRSLPISLPAVHVAAGLCLYLAVDGLPQPDPRQDDAITEAGASAHPACASQRSGPNTS